MQGKIFVIDGVDSTGKHTQTVKLYEHLKKDGFSVYMHSFPTYDEEQSALVKMYLNGDFGEHADDINYKQASAFYAVDRVATFLKELNAYYNNGSILILDRYTTSNMIHQASKLKTKEEIIEAINWIDNFEFNDLKLPRPDKVIYLNISREIREQLLRERTNNDGLKKDIHEQDLDYLDRSYKAGKICAEYFNWDMLYCDKDGKMRDIEDIHEEVYSKVLKMK